MLQPGRVINGAEGLAFSCPAACSRQHVVRTHGVHEQLTHERRRPPRATAGLRRRTRPGPVAPPRSAGRPVAGRVGRQAQERRDPHRQCRARAAGQRHHDRSRQGSGGLPEVLHRAHARPDAGHQRGAGAGAVGMGRGAVRPGHPGEDLRRPHAVPGHDSGRELPGEAGGAGAARQDLPAPALPGVEGPAREVAGRLGAGRGRLEVLSGPRDRGRLPHLPCRPAPRSANRRRAAERSGGLHGADRPGPAAGRCQPAGGAAGEVGDGLLEGLHPPLRQSGRQGPGDGRVEGGRWSPEPLPCRPTTGAELRPVATTSSPRSATLAWPPTLPRRRRRRGGWC